MESPQNGFVTTLGNLGDYYGVPFFGSFRESGKASGHFWGLSNSPNK